MALGYSFIKWFPKLHEDIEKKMAAEDEKAPVPLGPGSACESSVMQLRVQLKLYQKRFTCVRFRQYQAPGKAMPKMDSLEYPF